MYSVKENSDYIIISGLLLALIFVVLLIISFHENAHVGFDSKRVVEWKQPSELDAQFTLAISNRAFNIEYSKVERVLWQAKIDSQNDLIINSETMDLLKRAIAALPEVMSSQERKRLEAIIKKSMVSDQGIVMAKLLSDYYFYQNELTSRTVEAIDTKGNEKLRLLKASRGLNEQRQSHFFGHENALKIFSKHNKTVNYLNDRHIINLSEDLTPTQKQDRLNVLQEAYRNSDND